MSYPINTNIPAAGNNPSADQQPMQTNFANIFSYLGIDHTTPGTNPGDGQHNQVTFHANQAAPSIANGVSGLFANLVGGASQLFFQNASGSVQLTGVALTSSGSNYGLKTSFGIILNFGTATGSPSGSSVTFAVPFSSVLAIASGINNTSPSVTATFSGLSNSGVTVKSSQTNAVWYIAIGV